MLNRLRRFGAGFAEGTKGVAVGIYRHDCLGLAAQIAYSALFSLFPFLLFLRALVAYLPPTEQLATRLLDGLAQLVSTDSRLYQIVEQNVFNEIGAASVALLSVGIVLTLWSASGAVMTLIKAVNRAYGLEETRSWGRRRLMAAGLAIAGAILIPAGVLLLVFGSWIGDLIGRETGYDSAFHVLWVGLRWPVVFILLVVAVGAFFYFAPRCATEVVQRHPGGAVCGRSDHRIVDRTVVVLESERLPSALADLWGHRDRHRAVVLGLRHRADGADRGGDKRRRSPSRGPRQRGGRGSGRIGSR